MGCRPGRGTSGGAQGVALAVGLVLATAEPARPQLTTFRVVRLGPLHRAAVERALAGAARRLEDDECRRIFTDFRDDSGVTLADRLQAFGLSGPDYLRRVVFADGFGHALCLRPDVVALTAPGSRVVYVCGPRFWQAQSRDPARAEVLLLREALHTLGLGEDPPDSREITRRVAARCGR